MARGKKNYDFELIFQKLSEISQSKEYATFSKEVEASAEINKLREIVLDVSEENEQYFSTT